MKTIEKSGSHYSCGEWSTTYREAQSHCCTLASTATLRVNYTQIKKIRKNKICFVVEITYLRSTFVSGSSWLLIQPQTSYPGIPEMENTLSKIFVSPQLREGSQHTPIKGY